MPHYGRRVQTGPVGSPTHTAFNPTSRKCLWNGNHERSVFFSSQAAIFQEQLEEQIFPNRMSGDTVTSQEGPAADLLPDSVAWLERWRDPFSNRVPSPRGQALPGVSPARGLRELQVLSLARPTPSAGQAALGWQRDSAPLLGDRGMRVLHPPNVTGLPGTGLGCTEYREGSR